MLHLKLPTDPRWVNIAEMAIGEILIDHAWCEQKAATSCISLIVSNAEKEELVAQLTPIVAEEWGHFRKVLKELEKRKLKLGPPRKDEYVLQLMAHERKQVPKDVKLTDRLLINALIEARSCERFRLLSLHCTDAYFKSFYHDFMVAEAGHYTLFMDLAKTYAPEKAVLQRWQELLHIEADIMQNLTLRGDRIH